MEKKLVNRLKKIKGQVDGVIKMIERGDECEKIIIQFQAVKAAMDSAFSENLDIGLKRCIKGKDTKTMEKVIKLITKK